MHPTKTKIVYCKDGRRKGRYPNRTFDFLGYSFRPRLVKNSRRGTLFWSFTPAISRAALTDMRQTIRKANFRNRTQITLGDVARELNPLLRGWMGYYGRYSPSALYPVFRQVNRTLVAWAMRKYKRLSGHRTRASLLLESIAEKSPRLFVHWRKGTVGAFA
jgi:RNA-directed DNA polymerase